MTMRELLPSLWGREDRYPPTFNSLRKQIDRMFEDFTETLGLPERMEPGKMGLAPDMDVVESDHDIKLTMELPGVDEKDIDISVSGHKMTISGEKKSESEEKLKSGFRRERSYGFFHRSLTLPFEISPDRVQAHDNRGVLTVTVPKPAEAVQQTHKVHISGSQRAGSQASIDRSNPQTGGQAHQSSGEQADSGH